ncbi:hypothetical protein, partial [Streptomyces phyllanthi]|uniref:hypothetical protein n=1 Tax=Streptomyces phyllanthi TaxID=1803180 RepID=UPI001D157DA0
MTRLPRSAPLERPAIDGDFLDRDALTGSAERAGASSLLLAGSRTRPVRRRPRSMPPHRPSPSSCCGSRGRGQAPP